MLRSAASPALLPLLMTLAACAPPAPPEAPSRSPLEVAIDPAQPGPEPAPEPDAGAARNPGLKGSVYLSGDGRRTLAEARGAVALLHFWATFCAPCKQSLPDYQALSDRFGGRLVVIGLSVDELDGGDAVRFAAEAGVHFVIRGDPDRSVVDRWAPSTLPTTYVIDTEGRIAATLAGYAPGDAERTAKIVQALLDGGDTGKAP